MRLLWLVFEAIVLRKVDSFSASKSMVGFDGGVRGSGVWVRVPSFDLGFTLVWCLARGPGRVWVCLQVFGLVVF